MYCYCGECPQETPKREDYTFTCAKCFEGKEGWLDDLNLVLGRCDKCSRMAFCHAEEKKEDAEWHL